MKRGFILVLLMRLAPDLKARSRQGQRLSGHSRPRSSLARSAGTTAPVLWLFVLGLGVLLPKIQKVRYRLRYRGSGERGAGGTVRNGVNVVLSLL